MSRRTPQPASIKGQIERRRNEQDEAILAWLRSHGQAVQSTEIARATRISWTGVVGRLGALVRIGAVRRSETGKDRAGKLVITFQAAPEGHVAATHNEAPISFGRPEYREIA